jgi:hypothetical protein
MEVRLTPANIINTMENHRTSRVYPTMMMIRISYGAVTV